MELSIIIVNWNSKDYLKKCLESLQTNVRGIKFEVIVIDGASFDGCGEMLGRDFPSVRFIQSRINCGFAKANNEAFRASAGRSALFLNPDTLIVDDAIGRMLSRLKTLPEAGAVGCRLLNADGSLQTTSVQCVPTIANQVLDSHFLQRFWPKSSLWGTAALHEGGGEPLTVGAVSGACVMVKREVFERVGGFSEDYFMYMEDIDLGHKIENAGWKNYYLPDARVIHFGGGSSSESVSNFSAVMIRESIWRFLRKNRGVVYGLGYRVSMLLSALLRLIFLLICFPIQQMRSQGKAWSGSVRKWRAILHWSIFGERWSVRQS